MLSYAWTAPGATPSSSTAANPGFTYPAQGYYSLTLSVTTIGGCTVTQTFNNIVQAGTPTTPVTMLISPNPVCGNDTVTFTSPTSPTLPADKWIWNFGDGATDAGDSGQTVTHVYKKPGTFVIGLALTNFGCQTVGTASLVVNPSIPNFTYQVNCAPPLSSNLTVTFSDSTLHDFNHNLSYTWDFGDGSPVVTVSTAPYTPPPHTYASYGTYPVTLTVTDGACTNLVKKNVVLANVNASFTVTPDPVCRNQQFTLLSTSTITATTDPTLTIGNFIAGYDWQVGTLPPNPNGNSLNMSLPDTGNYPITLLLTDINGCKYTSPTGSVQVTGPTAHYTVSAGGCRNSPVTFTDNSTAYPGPPSSPIISWTWEFGDRKDTTFTGPPYFHSYADTGYFVVELTVTDNSHCLDSYVQDHAFPSRSPRQKRSSRARTASIARIRRWSSKTPPRATA